MALCLWLQAPAHKHTHYPWKRCHHILAVYIRIRSSGKLGFFWAKLTQRVNNKANLHLFISSFPLLSWWILVCYSGSVVFSSLSGVLLSTWVRWEPWTTSPIVCCPVSIVIILKIYILGRGNESLKEKLQVAQKLIWEHQNRELEDTSQPSMFTGSHVINLQPGNNTFQYPAVVDFWGRERLLPLLLL